jgi:hypothetical protein
MEISIKNMDCGLVSGKGKGFNAKWLGFRIYHEIIFLKKNTWTVSTDRLSEGLGPVHGSTVDWDSYPFVGSNRSHRLSIGRPK